MDMSPPAMLAWLDLSLFLTAFIPLFVAIDPVGMVPLFLSMTADVPAERRRRITYQSILVSAVIALGFMFVGRQLFVFLNITADDFRIAGGLILLVLAILDLLIVGKPSFHVNQNIGLVPLAMPLIAGPATLTTVLVLSASESVGHALTAVALLVNLGVLLAFMLSANWLARKMSLGMLTALSKLVMVLLAAIAVNFIRVGIMNSLAGRPVPGAMP